MMTKRLEVMGWDLMIRWSDNPHTTESADEIPEHIIRDIEYWLDLLEDQRNKEENNEEEEDEL